MEIAQYIVDLLRGQDEVSLAGLGTFTKTRVAGFFDQNSNVFYPPTYKISFKETETEDSSLIQYIISKENTSPSTAEDQIKSFISSILNGVENENVFEIKELGKFHKKDGILNFEAFENLESKENKWILNPIQEFENSEKPSEQIENEEERAQEIAFKENSTETDQEQVSNENEDLDLQETAPNRSWLKIFLLFVIFLLSLTTLFFLNPEFNTFVKDKSKGLFNSTSSSQEESPILLDSTKISADSLNLAVDSASVIADSIKQAQDSSIKAGVDTLATISNNESATFEIISAAFYRKSEADAYMKELSKKGIKSKIVENMPGKMLKISLGTFLDEETAIIELRKIHKEINKDAWIARIKPNKKSN
jgi:nucleoid DNA-binding protein